MTGQAREQQARAAAPRIVRVDITPLEYVVAPHKAYGMARGLNARCTLALIAVEADDGTVGYGEALGPLAPIREYVSIVRPFFLGRSIFDFELIAPQLSKVDKSVFAGVKIKIGVSPKSDRERVRRAREMLGDDILLMVDVNGNYTPDVALESLRAIEPFAIHWCEEPLPPTDVRGYAELRARSPIPIAAGEAFQTAHTFKRFIDARALDIVQPSVAACGGLRQGRRLAGAGRPE